MQKALEEKRKITLNEWVAKEAMAESMIPLIGSLYRERNVVTSVYSRPIINRSVTSILKAHKFAKKINPVSLSVTDTLPILEILSTLDLSPSRIDLGKLAHLYLAHLNHQEPKSDRSAALDLEAFVKEKVSGALKTHEAPMQPRDVVLYGFGRIGRLVARILIEKLGSGEALRLKAIVVRKGKANNDLAKRASLLRRDSVHGTFQGTIAVDEDLQGIQANGCFIKIIYSDDPKAIDYTEYGINDAILIDNTGVWRDETSLSQHLQAKGISKVLLTAPAKDDIKNVVFGVNNELVSQDDRLVSAASCTTNAIVPVLKAIEEEWGVKSGHVETVHAYTNDQNLIDNYHKNERRGRSAALNMVITETGAAKAVAKALPALEGKLTGSAIRVPTPNVSMAILNVNLEKPATREALNEFLRCAALYSSLQKQIDYIDSPEAVSSDFVGSRHACVVDAQSTIVKENQAVIYIWYDNEFGYSCQVVRLAQQMAGIIYPKFPIDG